MLWWPLNLLRCPLCCYCASSTRFGPKKGILDRNAAELCPAHEVCHRHRAVQLYHRADAVGGACPATTGETNFFVCFYSTCSIALNKRTPLDFLRVSRTLFLSKERAMFLGESTHTYRFPLAGRYAFRFFFSSVSCSHALLVTGTRNTSGREYTILIHTTWYIYTTGEHIMQ